MNTYVAIWEKDGIEYTASFDCEDWDAAESISEKNEWTLIGQYMDEQVIELILDDTSIH
jgi:hypothetical protein